MLSGDNTFLQRQLLIEIQRHNSWFWTCNTYDSDPDADEDTEMQATNKTFYPNVTEAFKLAVAATTCPTLCPRTRKRR